MMLVPNKIKAATYTKTIQMAAKQTINPKNRETS
jgi:hypothetical protein